MAIPASVYSFSLVKLLSGDVELAAYYTVAQSAGLLLISAFAIAAAYRPIRGMEKELEMMHKDPAYREISSFYARLESKETDSRQPSTVLIQE